MEIYLNENFKFLYMNKRGVRALYITGALVVALLSLSFGMVILTGGEYLPDTIREIFVTIGVLPPDVAIQINNFGFDCEGSDARFAVLVENVGSLPVSGFVAIINSENGQQEIEKEQEILSNRETWVDFFGLDCTQGDFVDAVITPKIMVNGNSIVYNGSSTNTSSSGSSGGGGGGGGDDDSGDDDPPFVWEQGRPTCEYNCEYERLLLTPMVQEGEDPYGHNDFAFFQDHNNIYHTVTIKSKRCTSDDDCDGPCSNNYCRPFDAVSENEFVHYTSPNAAEWTRQEDINHKEETGPDSLSVWAPHVYYNEGDGIYYMYYTGVNLEPCDNGDPGCEYYTQRIMLATNDGADLNNPANWIKQGIAMECDGAFSSWNDDDSLHTSPQWKKSCRDPMVRRYNSTHWIMYVHNSLSVATFPSERHAITYGFSDDLVNWEHYGYIPDTREGGSSCSEGPYVFEGDNGKYYLHYTCGTTWWGDEVIDNETVLTSTINFNDPSEFLYVNNPALVDGPYLVRAHRVNSASDRALEFDMYDINDTSNDLMDLKRPDGVQPLCLGCNPQPNLMDIGLRCEVTQDCSLDLSGCADYSGEPINNGGKCCDILNPSIPEEYCCLPTGDGDILNNEVPICKDVCPEPSQDNYNLCSEIDNHCKCDVTCPPGDEVPCSTGLPGYCDTGFQTCLDDGSDYGECIPWTQPGEYPEFCEDPGGYDEDCDGFSNGDDPDCDPSTCTIGEAYWGIDNGDDYVMEGDRINLIVNGEGCDGMTLNYEFWEYDPTNDDDPLTVSSIPYNPMFYGGTTITSWVTEWFLDDDGSDQDPEIKFVAFLNLDPTNSQTSIDFVEVSQP
jgi:hypothetical protein